MKKILTILSSFAVTATTAPSIVACDKDENKPVMTIKTKKDLDAFKAKVIDEGKKIDAVKEWKDKTITEVLKKDGSALDVAYLVDGNIELKIKGKKTESGADKDVDAIIIIAWTEEKTA